MQNNDLISRKAVTEVLQKLSNEPAYQHTDEDFFCGISSAMCEIDEIPAVDAVILPCKVGDPVWFVGTSNANRLKLGVIEATVEKLVLKQGGIYMKLSCNAMYETSCRSIGKTVFFSREEAEAALAERMIHNA